MANNKNLKPFKKGYDERRNVNGAFIKTVSYFNQSLKDEGHKPVTMPEIKDAYLTLIGLPMYKIAAIAKDDAAPALYRIVGKELLGGKGADYLEKALDRAIGKAKQELGVTDKDGNDVPLISAIKIIRPE